MNPNEIFKTTDALISKLMELDIHCNQNNIYAKLVVLGGSGILINLASQGVTFRPTYDIDVETIASSDFNKLTSSFLKKKVYNIMKEGLLWKGKELRKI